MTSFFLLAQAAPTAHQGWLTTKLLSTLTGDAEWVLWLLAGLSVISIAVMLERGIYFSTRSLPNSDGILLQLAKGDLDAVKTAINGKAGMEAAVLREGLSAVDKGPDTVDEIVSATMARERPRYERFLSVLGTLGSNTPFIGLFGTVIGIIKAFKDLGMSGAKGAEVQSTVMAGISEALVATAVGLAVAIPAVIGYNILQRSVKNTAARATALGHALVGHLRATGK
ncbi:MAG: MotA/TolQ/ExbB proton channel family protein [Archangium gephyra]|uniref:MotA/TolQ/ExbB proton channel family protein n=1 Tax=Archangium gephyra TaxID=48 RepID=A0A2W5THW4_9BACT|nr:MAG: MotA/TolQ/ExbB proton channel family protein [Archangium gephyra]